MLINTLNIESTLALKQSKVQKLICATELQVTKANTADGSTEQLSSEPWV
jgi:hypothetical protein